MDAALLAATEPDTEPQTAIDDQGMLEIDTGLGFSITESLNEFGTSSELVVTNINRSSEAFKAGLRNQDRLRALNGTSVSAIYEWEAGVAAIKKGSSIRIECEKPDGARAFYILRK
jgi:predicted metalloprotease with PDZ domain